MRALSLSATILSISALASAQGQFLYVANGYSRQIFGYLIDANTAGLSDVAGSPFPTGLYPFYITAHPNGGMFM